MNQIAFAQIKLYSLMATARVDKYCVSIRAYLKSEPKYVVLAEQLWMRLEPIHASGEERIKALHDWLVDKWDENVENYKRAGGQSSITQFRVLELLISRCQDPLYNFSADYSPLVKSILPARKWGKPLLFNFVQKRI